VGAAFSLQQGVAGLEDKPRPGDKPKFSPGVALHLVKMACEMPDLRGCSLSQWDCEELAQQLVAENVLDSIFVHIGVVLASDPEETAALLLVIFERRLGRGRNRFHVPAVDDDQLEAFELGRNAAGACWTSN
jgi:hypothetical protein